MALTINDYNLIHHTRGGGDSVFQSVYIDRSGATISYWAFENNEGKWIIQKEEDNGDNTRDITYASGASAVATAWTARASQTYGLYSVIFP